MKKTFIAIALLGASSAFAQSTSYSTATFNWQKTVGNNTASQATNNVVLTQGIDGTLSASGGVTFSAGSQQRTQTAADARTAYATFANQVFDLVKTNVTAIKDATTAYNTASTTLGATAIGAETLTFGANNAVVGTLNNSNNVTLYNARNSVLSAMNTLSANIGTANTALGQARSAIAGEGNLNVSGEADWNAYRATGTMTNGFYRVYDATGATYYQVLGNGTQVSPVFESSASNWTNFGSSNAPVSQFQNNARTFSAQ